MGTDASPRNPQPRLRDLQRVLPICSAFPARGGTEKLGGLLRFGHRQFPRHQPRRFSGSQGVGVYLHFFERIARKASGDPDFVLPYWSYDDPAQSSLPTAFLPDDDEFKKGDKEAVPPLSRRNPLARA